MPHYNFYYWGPLLFKTKLSSSDLEACVKLCSKEEKGFGKYLVGMIKHEHFVNPHAYREILAPYLESFKTAFRHWYGPGWTSTPGIESQTAMTITTAWVNFMTAGEMNPPHTHRQCDFSSVLFVQIPESLKEEHKNFKEHALDKQKRGGAGPGALQFIYGEKQPYSITQFTPIPQAGDLYIFPATLTHVVFPFKSKGERISIGANFLLDTNGKDPYHV